MNVLELNTRKCARKPAKEIHFNIRSIATFYACYCCGYFVFVSFSVSFLLCFALFRFFIYLFIFLRFALRPSWFVFNVYHQGRRRKREGQRV